jgi:hydroxyethylthiazole kinase-like sugar kinase family protein
MSSFRTQEILVEGQAFGPSGPAGSAGVITIGPSFTLPADAVETSITLNSAINVLETGQFLYGVLPGNIIAKIRRSGSQYFIKSLFKNTDLVFPASTKLYITGDRSILAIAADVTISVSGATLIQIEPNPFSVGASALAMVGGGRGLINRDNIGTYFTPASTLPAPVALTAYVSPVIISADPTQSVQLGASPNGLNLDSYKRLSLGSADGIDFKTQYFSPNEYKSYKNNLGLIESYLTLANGLILGIANDGSVYLVGAQIKPSRSNNLDAIESWTDRNGRVALGITSLGDLLTAWGKFRRIEKNNLGLIEALTDNNNRTIYGIKEDGSLFAPGILSAPLEAYNSIYFLQPDEYGNRQIWRLAAGSLIQLTFRGDNSGVVIGDNNTLLFITNRNGASEYFRMNQDGSKQFYCFFDSTSFDTTLNHILVTGQSLSRGFSSSPVLTTTQPYNNLKFNTGTMNADYFANGAAVNVSPTSFVPLVENDVETGYATLANKITEFANVIKTNKYGIKDYRVLISGHGYSAAAYSQIKKGTQSYTDGLDQVTKGRSIAIAQGLTNKVRAIFVVHGESDHISNNTNYKANLLEWHTNYNADIASIYGASENIPMFHSQVSSWGYYNAAPTPTISVIPQAQLDAHRENPGKIICVCPKYFIPYYSPGDNVHLTNVGEQILWSYYTKAYRHVVLQKKVWTGVQPTTIVKAGLVITATFTVPVAPLVLDTANVSNPGNFGFEVADSANAVLTINSVVLSGNQVVITVASGVPARLRYAYRSNAGGGVAAGAGPTIGPRGCLRDSDSSVHSNNFVLYNWCMHFNDPIT